ncbi:hypothetical protein BDL97_08G023800 [Sphagnum fallax]|nr:hypothetical protein BDL97_08G023800 [Sphagnum fallax]KAH8953391.1 hypothetical protein BDL97_08G023800 [Sphagnum fallax]
MMQRKLSRLSTPFFEKSKQDTTESKMVLHLCFTLWQFSSCLDSLNVGGKVGRQVIGVDVDADILNMALHNSTELEVNMELMQCDLAQPLPWRGSLVDTIVTFPPLGHRRKGVPDMEFLSNAFKVAQTVYSLHKTATRKLRYELPAPYKMPEEEQEATIALDLWRFTMRSSARSCPAT